MTIDKFFVKGTNGWCPECSRTKKLIGSYAVIRSDLEIQDRYVLIIFDCYHKRKYDRK